MKILVTGANGYLGQNLIKVLWREGHEIVALVKDKKKVELLPFLKQRVHVIEGDLLDPKTLFSIPKDIVVAYYLVHSMKERPKNFISLEEECAVNFINAIVQTSVNQVVYLSGLTRTAAKSEHMISRQNVEEILRKSSIPVTVFRVGIIIGEGSASFEIIRDLVEKLPLMVAPKWVNARCQPLALNDVLFYLSKSAGKKECVGKTFEIGGEDILTYKEILLQFAKFRNLRRFIQTIPFLTPYLSSLWLYLITSTNFFLAKSLVNSLKIDAICTDTTIDNILPHRCLTFKEALEKSFQKIEQNPLIDSWEGAAHEHNKYGKFCIKVPSFGCLKMEFLEKTKISKNQVLQTLWKIKEEKVKVLFGRVCPLRHWINKSVKKVRARNVKEDSVNLVTGSNLDFFTVLLADRKGGRLILYTKMEMLGELWLDWHIYEHNKSTWGRQLVRFRPIGVLGRFYWSFLYIFCNSTFKKLLSLVLKTNGYIN